MENDKVNIKEWQSDRLKGIIFSKNVEENERFFNSINVKYYWEYFRREKNSVTIQTCLSHRGISMELGCEWGWG